jgi:glycosyltransferase involved in cell wall biosynthesis
MAARKRIALTFDYIENWVAGSYYVVNIIRALNHLEDLKKPHIVILYQNINGLELIREISYPYISFINTDINSGGFFKWFFRKVRNRIKGDSVFYKRALNGVNYIFEGNEGYPFIKNHYYWVHDFQEFRLPEFFSREDAEKRSALPRKVSEMSNVTLILSSYDALNDFGTFFPGYKCKVKVWRFTSSLPDFSNIKFQEECKRFNIKVPFFICSNQFWQHKNHQVILNAINLLKEKKLSFQVVFTGKDFDFRTTNYYESLQKFVAENHLESWAKFIGFIDRKVQLCLAKNAISYIQPSLFEGWSTTVEDAKCLNQLVLLSDIPVHREQLNYNVTFFNPFDPNDLASKMENMLAHKLIKERRDYSENILKYGSDIIETFTD